MPEAIGTTELVARLRAEGFRISIGYLSWLLRDEQVPAPMRGPGGCLLWTHADMEGLRAILRRRNRGPESPTADRHEAQQRR